MDRMGTEIQMLREKLKRSEEQNQIAAQSKNSNTSAKIIEQLTFKVSQADEHLKELESVKNREILKIQKDLHNEKELNKLVGVNLSINNLVKST